MPPHCGERNDLIDTRLPSANVQFIPENTQFIVAPFGEARPPMALIDRINRRAAARECRLNRQWVPYLRTRRMSLAFMQDFSHFFERISYIHYLDDTAVQIRRVPRRNLLDLRLELPWPSRRCTDLVLRPISSIAGVNNNHLWIWMLTFSIAVYRHNESWEVRRSEYFVCPRLTNRNGGRRALVISSLIVELPGRAMAIWCYAHA